MNAKFKDRYRKLGIATALALICELAVLLGAAVHLLLGNPESASDLFGIVGGVGLISTLLLPLYLIASLAAAFLHWQQRPAQHAT